MMGLKVIRDKEGTPQVGSNGFRRPSVFFIAIGVALMGLHIVLVRLSPDLVYRSNLPQRPILILVGVQLLAGILYLLVVKRIRKTAYSTALLVWVVAVGVLLRASMFWSAPMLEIDYYRYFWDGAVFANRISPYVYVPSRVFEGSRSIPPVLYELAEQARPIRSQINHPQMTSLYPPVTQAAFALAYWIRPWSLSAWRLVLLMLDAVMLGLMIALLRAVKRPLSWLVIYWWNPLLVKEVFNSGHMDPVMLVFIMGAVFLAIRQRYAWAAGSLALAVGAKVWPVVLLPFVLRPVFRSPKRLVAALCVFFVIAGALLLPVYMASGDSASGFTNYGRRWELNDALFMLVVWVAQVALTIIGVHPGHGQLTARVFVLILLSAWTAWLARRKITDPIDFCERCLLVIAGVFLLSPTQFPWYSVWLVPLLAIRPRWSLLLLTPLLSLYYLRFYFEARGNVLVFDRGLVWLEYLPIWCLLIREWYVRRYRRSTLLSEVSA